MMLDEENISRQTINARMREHHMEPAHILEVSTMDLLIQFAETGLGIAGVVRQFVEPELKTAFFARSLWILIFRIGKSDLCAEKRQRTSPAPILFPGYLKRTGNFSFPVH